MQGATGGLTKEGVVQVDCEGSGGSTGMGTSGSIFWCIKGTSDHGGNSVVAKLNVLVCRKCTVRSAGLGCARACCRGSQEGHKAPFRISIHGDK